MSHGAEVSGYERLAKLVERELELAQAGDFDRLDAAIAATGAAIAELPSPPPVAARAALVRARAVRERVEIEVAARRDQIDRSRTAQRTARKVRRTYSHTPDPGYSISA